MITPNSKIKEILAINDKLLTILLERLQGAVLLKIPLLRSFLFSWMTLRQAASFANANLTDLVNLLNSEVGFSKEYQNKVNNGKIKGTWGNWEDTNYRTLDVRPILEKGGEPFTDIITAIESLKDDEGLALIAPFEPFPLYVVLEDRGWAYRLKKINHDFFILFRKTSDPVKPIVPKNEVPEDYQVEIIDGVHHIDVRSLEPPEPMARVLSLISSLPEGSTVHSKHDRKPVFLLDKLDQLGYRFSINEISEEEIELTIQIVNPS